MKFYEEKDDDYDNKRTSKRDSNMINSREKQKSRGHSSINPYV
jgi:hypothetical protein